eukprot:scaffold65608_cov71-Phaeocystis_antarctica.AAC.4
MRKVAARRGAVREEWQRGGHPGLRRAPGPHERLDRREVRSAPAVGRGRRREHGKASGEGVRGDARLLGQGGARRRAKSWRAGEPVPARVAAAVRNEEERARRGGGQRVRQGGAAVGEERGGSRRSVRARQGHLNQPAWRSRAARAYARPAGDTDRQPDVYTQ